MARQKQRDFKGYRSRTASWEKTHEVVFGSAWGEVVSWIIGKWVMGRHHGKRGTQEGTGRLRV